jgi:acyl-CoA thioester hydrolase
MTPSDPRSDDELQFSSSRSTAGPRIHECHVDIEVPFHDVDALEVVWHGHYYKYFELARTALMRGLGLDSVDLRKIHFGFVIIESGCRHIAPLRYGDRARVMTWICEIKYRIAVRYELRNLSNEQRIASAHTTLVTTTEEGELLYRTPPLILRRLDPEGLFTNSSPDSEQNG